MKNIFKRTSATLILLAGLSVILVGCGTGADSGGMGNKAALTDISSK